MTGLRVERPDEGVARVVLDRPKRRNALDDDLLLRTLPGALADLGADESVRVVIVTGTDPDFCAGADLECSGLEQPSPVASERFMTASHRTPLLLRSMPKPTIAAVNGAAVGAGLGIALACDIRLAGPRARFIAPFLRMGLPPDFGTSYFLPQAVGASTAMELFLTARPVGAEEAARLRLVSRVVEDVQAEALELARVIAANPAGAVAMTKRNVFGSLERGPEEAVLDHEVRSVAIALHGEEFAKMLAAWRAQIMGSGSRA